MAPLGSTRFSTVIQERLEAQAVAGDRVRCFRKELLRLPGDQPLAVVRKRLAGAADGAPVVLIHGFGQNRYAWHLPARSFANFLAELGYDVWNLDLRGHGRSATLGGRRGQGVFEYIEEDLPLVLAALHERRPEWRPFLVGHSLGGLCAAAAAARAPEAVAGVVALGAPHALGADHPLLGGALRALALPPGLRRLLGGSSRRLPVDLIGRAVRATRLAWDLPWAPMPVHAWKPGSFSPDEVRSYVARSFDGASLGVLDDLLTLATEGVLRSRRDGTSYTRLIEESPLPLLIVAGAADRLANPGAVRPLYERSRALDKRYAVVDAGHGDLLVGRQAPATTWPLVADWLERRGARARPALHGSAEPVIRMTHGR